MLYQYPLQIKFKVLALAARFSITDSTGKEIFYIEQKIFAMREAIKVFNNQTEKQQIFGIKTQKVIDFGAQYFFYNGTDEATPIGSIKEEGMRTLLKATYNILNKANEQKYQIIEINPWTRVVDALLSQLPFVGVFSGYFFNPVYHVINVATNQPVLILRKQASFLERQFGIEVVDANLSPEDETSCLLGIMMMILLQKNRG